MDIELKLTIMERVTLPSFFPQFFESLEQGLTKREIEEKTKLTKAEKEKINYKELARGLLRWGGFLKCNSCGTVYKDPYDEIKLASMKCDECEGEEFNKFEQYTELQKVIKFAKAEILFLDNQVTRLKNEKKIEDRHIDLSLKIRERMKEIPEGLQEVKKTIPKDRK